MRPFALLAILLGIQLAACTETPEHKAAIGEMERRHVIVVETMSGTGGK
jgi:flagellar biosynthesis GTPase FlhF